MTDEAERFRAAVMERLHVGSYDGMSMREPKLSTAVKVARELGLDLTKIFELNPTGPA